MQTKNTPSESGQAIVLIVLAIIVLLGFTALAVDGSLVYADRRWAQNAADASALAGAGAAAEYLENNYIYSSGSPWSGSGNTCTGVAGAAAVQGIASSIARATENDYNLPNGITTEFGGVKVECLIESGMPYLDVTVVVKDTTDTAFAQVVFPDGLENTVTAVTRVEPAIGMGHGNAIVALDDRDCPGGGITGLRLNGLGGGTNYLEVNYGGIWSNGCLETPGNPNVTVNNGGTADYFYPGNDLEDGTDIIFPDGGGLNRMSDPPDSRMSADAYTLPIEPVCDGHRYTNNTFHNLVNADGEIELAPGLYCLTNTLRINNNEVVTGTMVTIVQEDGIIDIAGGATVNLSAPPSNAPYIIGGAIPGLLFYVPASNTNCDNNCVTINGDATTTFTGTILAPAGEVRFLGNNGARIFGQIIGYDVEVGGSSGASVTYIPNNVVIFPTYLNMHK